MTSPEGQVVQQEARHAPPPIPEKLRREGRERQALLEILSTKGLTAEVALDIVADYKTRKGDEGFQKEIEAICQSFSLDPDALPEDDMMEIAVLYSGVQKYRKNESTFATAVVMSEAIRHRLITNAYLRLDELHSGIKRAASYEELEANLTEVMRSMQALAKQMPPGPPQHDAWWEELYRRFQGVVSLRHAAKTPEVTQLFEKLFDKFRDFIEGDFVGRKLYQAGRKGESVSMEHVMRDVYGRTPEEVTQIKERNRAAVVQEVLAQKDNPTVTIDTLTRLHALNNKDIVPGFVSQLRTPGQEVTFARRHGILGEDVPKEVQGVLDRAIDLINRNLLRDVSRPVYEMSVASMHNDLLDIHPFLDRNGSISLLFIELMMAKVGYVPSSKRESSYYKQLSQALNYNPLAVGVVGYEQYKIGHEAGYFQGETAIAKKEVYKQRVEALSAAYTARKKQIQNQIREWEKAQREKKKAEKLKPVNKKS